MAMQPCFSPARWLAPRLLVAALALALGPAAPLPARAQEDKDLQKMQERIDEVNQDAVQKAAEMLAQGDQGEGGEKAAKGLAKMIAKKTADGDASFGSPAYWFFMIFFSVVGMGYGWSGKRSGDLLFMGAGAVLTIFPYFVTNMIAFTLIGIAFIVLPFVLRGR